MLDTEPSWSGQGHLIIDLVSLYIQDSQYAIFMQINKSLRANIVKKTRSLKIKSTVHGNEQLVDVLSSYAIQAPQLRHLNLEHCGDLFRYSLEFLIDMPNLQTLQLGYWYSLNADQLEPLNSLSKLEILDLTQCYRLTDDALQHITNLPLLELNLCNCMDLTANCLTNVTEIQTLQALNLCFCHKINDNAHDWTAKIIELKNLTKLDISGCLATDEQILLLEGADINIEVVTSHDNGICKSIFNGPHNIQLRLQDYRYTLG